MGAKGPPLGRDGWVGRRWPGMTKARPRGVMVMALALVLAIPVNAAPYNTNASGAARGYGAAHGVGAAMMPRYAMGSDAMFGDGLSAYAPQGDPIRGKRVAQERCASCHGADGNSTDPRYPKLAGQKPAYLYEQLWAFRSSVRASDVMSAIVAALSEPDAADTSTYFADQGIRPSPVKDNDLTRAGESIYYRGSRRGAPACAMCHSPEVRRAAPMMGMMGMGRLDAPLLSGQHAMYIVEQLNRFASGERRGIMMNRIAAALTDQDRVAVAQYVSGLH